MWVGRRGWDEIFYIVMVGTGERASTAFMAHGKWYCGDV